MGKDAQARMSSSAVLIAGLKGSGIEIGKRRHLPIVDTRRAPTPGPVRRGNAMRRVWHSPWDRVACCHI